MMQVDFGSVAGTVSTLAASVGLGWGSCHLYIVTPLRSRLEKLEAKLDKIDEQKDEEIARLRDIVNSRVGG